MPNDLLGTSIPPGTLMVPSGRPGAQGWPAASLIAQSFTVPPIGGTVAVEFVNTAWLTEGAVIFVGGMYGRVVSISGTTVTLERIVGGVETGVGIEEAPGPPEVYGRHDGTWLPVLPLSDFTQANLGGPFLPTAGGNLTGDLTTSGGASVNASGDVTAANITAAGAIAGASVSVSNSLYAASTIVSGGDVVAYGGGYPVHAPNGTVRALHGSFVGSISCWGVGDTGDAVFAPNGPIFTNHQFLTHSASWGVHIPSGTIRTLHASIGGNMTVYGTFANPSDARLKHDVEPYSRGLAAICALQPKSFRWNDDAPCPDKESYKYGLIAQEVAEVLPELAVTIAPTDPHAPEGTVEAYDLNGVVAVLINAVKELAAKVEAR